MTAVAFAASPPRLLDVALLAHEHGFCVVPARSDGSKAPLVAWKHFQHERPSEAQLRKWCGVENHPGLGLVCGAVSGNLEIFEFEGRAVHDGTYDRFLEAAKAAGLIDVFDRIADGYQERTPSGGYHYPYRVEGGAVPGNTKLAQRPGPNNTVEVLIETRGEGGFVIIAPSNGPTHPTGGAWKLEIGGLDTIATITWEERERLHALLRTFDEMPAKAAPMATVTALPVAHVDGERPGDKFNRDTTWAEILEPAGWTQLHTDAKGITHWRRPGKPDGVSATTNSLGTDRLKVHSTSTVFDTNTTYDRFGAWACLNRMTIGEAAKYLSEQGYGSNRIHLAQLIVGHNNTPDPDADTPEPDSFFIDWDTVWDLDLNEDWLYDPIIARGRAHAIYAQAKVGKSLLALSLVAKLATERDDVIVIYLDYEMTINDVIDRMRDMGYGPESSLKRLRYAVLPSLPPLDHPEGARALLAIVQHEQAAHPDKNICVIIDTTSRAVAGQENDADTFRDFYRETGLRLKQRGITWCRIDHAGKDTSKGQRGSSAKNDDVDVVWKVTANDDGLELHRTHARMNWVPLKLTLRRHDDPLRFEIVEGGWPAGTKKIADLLDELGVPVDTSERKAGEALRGAGKSASQHVLRAALRYRREIPVASLA